MARKQTPPNISTESQQCFVRFANEAIRTVGVNYNLRSRMQEIDRLYQRENDFTAAQQRARLANRLGDSSKMQNVTLPVVMPQVESMLSELTEIFLSSYPIFPIFSKPQLQDAAMQMETIIGEQGVRFGWAAELLQCMRDGLKYNLMGVEVDWKVQKTYAVESRPQEHLTEGSSVETQYEGNAIKRVDMYNAILDVRVPPFEVHTRGEYAGYTEIVGRIEMKQRMLDLNPLYTMNARLAFESGMGQVSTSAASNAVFIPQVNPNALIEPTSIGAGQNVNWMAWAGLEARENAIQYSDCYEWTVLYARIIPAEHKIYRSNSGIPQIWKMIIVNRRVCVFAQQQTNAHNYLPIIVAQATEDGLGWQAKSFADNAAPYQELASALYNSGLASQRRKVYDRFFYDPSRINKADMDRVDPVARIPVKKEGYGKPISEAYQQVPYRDEGIAGILSFGQQVVEMADVANGQNRVQRGQFQKGNKTRHEYQDVMDKSNARPRMTALVLENRFFQPIKHILKLNTLQFQPPTKLFNRNSKEQVQIDPVQLRAAALEFRVADGLLPTDAYINLELFQAIAQMAAQNPILAQGWDIPSMIFYWMKLEGATWIDDFKAQQPTATGAPNANTPSQPGAAPVTPAAV